MGIVLVIALIGLVAGIGGAMFFFIKIRSKSSSGLQAFRTEVDRRRGYIERLQNLEQQFVEKLLLQRAGRTLITMREALKTERGRIIITQAELETVEARLRELEEIERELAASAIDAQEEVKILEKKRDELKAKNDALKQQIADSMAQVDSAITDLQLGAEVEEQIQDVKRQILETELKSEKLLAQLEMGSQQYVILKKRYDALDIEYAQLYEKFAAAESSKALN